MNKILEEVIVTNKICDYLDSILKLHNNKFDYLNNLLIYLYLPFYNKTNNYNKLILKYKLKDFLYSLKNLSSNYIELKEINNKLVFWFILNNKKTEIMIKKYNKKSFKTKDKNIIFYTRSPIYH